jgi:hypothetical protein
MGEIRTTTRDLVVKNTQISCPNKTIHDILQIISLTILVVLLICLIQILTDPL